MRAQVGRERRERPGGTKDTAEVLVEPAASAAAARFRTFFAHAEPRLRRALVAAYGPDLGTDATADALAWSWQHFDRVEAMDAPLGYLWRVGQTSVRRTTRRRRRESTWVDGRILGAHGTDLADVTDRSFEPALVAALGRLSPRQRVAVVLVLVHGYGCRLAEVAEVQGCGVSTVRNHLDRGLRALRSALGVDDA
jgi:RNA polymerase sigma factor (sigma-70 family)